jgi:hypothetical protein
MSASPDTAGLIQQLVFQQNYLAGQYADIMARLESLVRFGGSSLLISLLGSALFCGAMLLIYRPKLTRGALWVPAFGLFGGTPTLYMRTRPASVLGIFATARRLRRATAWSKARPSHSDRRKSHR